MITNSGVSTELATRHVAVYDAVTLTVSRGRIIRFPGGNGVGGVATPIVDSVRWTSAPVPLRVYDPDGSGPYLFNPLSSAAYSRESLGQKAGREVAQISLSVMGSLPITLSTACDETTGALSGSFATSLMELAILGLLDGAKIAIDQIVLPSGQFPTTPASAGSAYGIVTTNPVRKFAGIVRQATPSMETVTLACCDPMILGGGSVPVGIFSPLCRWDFCDGRCPVDWNLQSDDTGTHQEYTGSQITFPTSSLIQFPGGSQAWYSWGSLVPHDGPMMGMRFQLGATAAAGGLGPQDFADTLPWAWSCAKAHLEFQCSKFLENPNSHSGGPGFWVSMQRPRDCLAWNGAPRRAGLPSSLNRFGGFPDMPQPESA